MLGAIPFDTLVFIALVLVASFLRWISKQAEAAKGKTAEGEPTQPEPVPPREGTDEERVRRFLEALGQPTSRPPPRIQKRAVMPKEKGVVVPQRRPIFSPLPPLTTVPPPLPVEVQTASPEPAVIEPEMAPLAVPVVAMKEKILSPISFPETAQRATIYPEVTALISSERGLRDAIILREIFGPPRSLQTLEF